VKEYGTQLLNSPSLWRVAADYLLSCPFDGRKLLELSLERIPINSEKDAQKLLAFCKG